MPDTDREARLEEIEGLRERLSDLRPGSSVADGYYQRTEVLAPRDSDVSPWAIVLSTNENLCGAEQLAEDVAGVSEHLDWLLSEIDRLKAKLEGEDV